MNACNDAFFTINEDLNTQFNSPDFCWTKRDFLLKLPYAIRLEHFWIDSWLVWTFRPTKSIIYHVWAYLPCQSMTASKHSYVEQILLLCVWPDVIYCISCFVQITNPMHAEFKEPNKLIKIIKWSQTLKSRLFSWKFLRLKSRCTSTLSLRKVVPWWPK